MAGKTAAGKSKDAIRQDVPGIRRYLMLRALHDICEQRYKTDSDIPSKLFEFFVARRANANDFETSQLVGDGDMQAKVSLRKAPKPNGYPPDEVALLTAADFPLRVVPGGTGMNQKYCVDFGLMRAVADACKAANLALPADFWMVYAAMVVPGDSDVVERALSLPAKQAEAVLPIVAQLAWSQPTPDTKSEADRLITYIEYEVTRLGRKMAAEERQIGVSAEAAASTPAPEPEPEPEPTRPPTAARRRRSPA